MTRGVLIGGVVGGIVMFLWGAISHMVLPVGQLGMKAIPEEARLLETMQSTMPEPGLYVYPWYDGGTPAEEARWRERIRVGPSGLIVHMPRGNEAMTWRQLCVELLADIACAILAGLVLCAARERLPSYPKRVLCVASLGLLPWLSISASNWTWYHYPTPYFLGEGLDQFVGFALTGLVVAATVKDP